MATKKPTLTRWFGFTEPKPEKPGVYQVTSIPSVARTSYYAWFDGRRWGHAYTSIMDAYKRRHDTNFYAQQSKDWRGLAEKPE